MKEVQNYILISSVVILGIGILLFCYFTGPTVQGNEHKQSINPIDTRTISGEHVNVFLGTFGNITFNTNLPGSPGSLPVYTGVFGPGDRIDKSNGSWIGEGVNVPLGSEAYAIALTQLDAYGGVPPDAIPSGVTTNYAELVNRTTYEIVRRYAQDTMVTFTRRIDGRYVMGDKDVIRVLLGDNGKAIWVYKEWRNYTYTGEVPVIPVEKSIEKLEKGDTINQYLSTQNDVSIYNVTLGYYVKGFKDPVTTLEPIWIFSGDTTSGSNVAFYVYARQFANFTATPTSGKVPLNVTFTDTSDASPTKWLWNFGDGTNSTVQNPVHQYTTAGRYNVSLKAWNDLGSDTIDKPLCITVSNLTTPVANFTANITTGLSPLTVAFNDTSTNSPTFWLWEFGDGYNSTERNPVYRYYRGGNYTVNLTALNADGSGTLVKSDYVIVIKNPPVPNFTATPRSGKVPLTVAFNDTTTGGTPTLWYWTFGDGTNTSGPNPVHVYTAPGNYSVDLETANGDGDFNLTMNDYITVLPLTPPIVNFTATPLSGKVPLTVSFNDTSSNVPTNWSWTFGDGSTSALQSPVHTYTTPGNYTVILNATNADGTGSLIRSEYISISGVPPTTIPTTKPTPRPTRQPLSPLTAIAGVAIMGLVYVARKKRE